MKNEPLLRFEDASLGYGRRAVLTGVSYEVAQGSFLGILGHNGSGKSTMLKTMLGLLPPLKGRFRARGAGGKPRYGYVPQKEKLDPIYPLTAYEVAAMGSYRSLDLWRRLRGQGPQELVRRCLKQCGALELSAKRYSDLSGGQRQRVLIARALAAEPELLVLDEPLAGIDVTTQGALLKLFEDFKRRQELTILMVSHRVQHEKSLFTHVAWVDEGKVEVGPTDKMLSASHIMRIFEAEL
ncbi:MAG: metal ABC transporter ATP-binding protein [Elusimicrobia bacterium]|nr:metal ABC transporter ATP-binding protein [Elusimicrobiota bacterium]MDE2236646.1 metal ABC transporter ATP-binding protein [Elusimicrobiota bacterium]MDE2425176.1 metal ABC transporter ATP-binding protein [Elusimicrobiota bacterium]